MVGRWKRLDWSSGYVWKIGSSGGRKPPAFEGSDRIMRVTGLGWMRLGDFTHGYS